MFRAGDTGHPLLLNTADTSPQKKEGGRSRHLRLADLLSLTPTPSNIITPNKTPSPHMNASPPKKRGTLRSSTPLPVQHCSEERLTCGTHEYKFKQRSIRSSESLSAPLRLCSQTDSTKRVCHGSTLRPPTGVAPPPDTSLTAATCTNLLQSSLAGQRNGERCPGRH